RNGRLYVRGLGLHALVTYRGKLSQLVGHATFLTAHTQTAGLAGVTAIQRLRRVQQTYAPQSLECVENLFGTAAHYLEWLGGLDIGHAVAILCSYRHVFLSVCFGLRLTVRVIRV